MESKEKVSGEIKGSTADFYTGKLGEQLAKSDRVAFGVYDEEGSNIGGFWKSKKDEDISSGDTIYRRKSTGEVSPNIATMMSVMYANTEKDLKFKASIDKSGKITVDAPAIVKQNEKFRETVNPMLEYISQQYQQNPDYKYALLKDSDETKTSEEWLNDLNDGKLNELMQATFNREVDKYATEAEYGVMLDDDQIVMKNTNGLEYNPETGKVVKSNDYAALALPQSIKDLDVFKDISNYDDGITTVGAFKEKWDRGGWLLNRRETDKENWNKLSWDEKARRKIEGGILGNADSDADFLEVYDAVNGYFEKGDYSDKDEFAQMYALRSFINQNAPGASFFMKANDFINNTRTAVVEGAADWVVKAGELVDTINDFGFEKLYGYENTNEHFATDFLRPELEKLKEDTSSRLLTMNKAAGTAYNVVEVATPLLMDIAIGNAAGEAAAVYGAKAVSSVAGSILYNMAPAAESVATVADIIAIGSETASEAEKLLSLSKVAGSLANAARTNLVMANRATRVGRMIDAARRLSAQADHIIGNGGRVAGYMRGAGEIKEAIDVARKGSKITKAVTTIADIQAQATMDTMMSDPGLFREFMLEADDKSKAYVMEQMAWNYGGFAAMGAAELAFKGFSKTSLGMMINSDLAHIGAATQYGVSELGEKIKSFLRGGKSSMDDVAEKVAKAKAAVSRNPGDAKAAQRLNYWLNKEKAVAEQTINRKTNKAIIESWRDNLNKSDSIFQVKESIDSYKNLLDFKSEANIQINRIWRADVSAKVADMTARYEDWADTRKTFLDKVSKALEVEKRDNIDLKDAINLGKDSILPRTLARSSNDYVSKAYRSNILNNFIEAAKKEGSTIPGNDVARAKRELEGLNEWLVSYKESHSAELVTALDEVLASGKDFSGMTQTVKVREGVMNASELDEMRASDVFKDGYLRQQRMPKSEMGFRRGQNLERKELRGIQEIVLGADPNESYQDVVMTLFEDVELAAKESYRKQALTFFDKIGFKVETTISGEELSGIRKSQKLASAAGKKIEEGVKSVFTENLLDDIFEKQVTEREVSEALLGRAQVKANQSLSDLEKLKKTKTTSRQFRTTAPERRKFVRGLDDGQIDELLMTFQDHPFFDAVEDDATFREFLDNLDGETRNNLLERIGLSVEHDTSNLTGAEKILSDFNAQPKYNKASFEQALGKKVIDTGPKGYYSVFVDENSDRMISDLSEIKNVDESWAKIKKDYLEAKRAEGVTSITPKQFNKQAQALRDSGRDITFADFQEALQKDGSLLADAKRSYLLNSDLVKKGSYGDRTIFGEKITNLDDIIANAKREEAIFQAEMIYSENKKNLDDLLKAYNIEGMNTELTQMFNNVIDDVVETVAENNVLKQTLSSVTKNYDEAVEYSVLKDMVNGKGKASDAIAKKFSEAARKNFEGQMRTAGRSKEDAERLAKRFERHAKEWFNEVIEDRYLKSCNKLIALGEDVSGDGYVDYFAKIGAIADSIDERKTAEYVVKTFGENGREEYVIVDPIVSSIFSDVPVRLKEAGVAGKWHEANKIFCQTFRAGTTGALVPASLIRQGFRDTAQAVIVGNAIDGVDKVKREMTNLFGQRLADELSENMPDLFDYLKKNTKSETELFEKLVAREEAIGMAGISAEFESNLYKYSKDVKQSIFDQITNSDEAKSMALSDRVSDFLGRFEGLNNMREEYLRKRVYMNAMRDGMEIGLSNETSRMYAEFMRSEATTNFSRGVYHLNNLANSVPYFRSSINGAKSFWRLYAIDPVGITTRMVTGLVVPAIALTTVSLSNDEDKRIYKQIPEYEKDGSLVMVMNGQIMSIPIPQELGKIINPIRTMVEKIHDGNDKSFGDLMMNNLVGFSPINLQGFVNVDADRLLAYDSDIDKFVQTRLLPGASKMLSGMLPPMEKSAVMMVTGKDPFTGKDIDRRTVIQDDETGENRIATSQESELANSIAYLTKGKVPAGMAAAVIKNLFGKGNRYVQDAIPSLVNNLVVDEQSFGESIKEAAASTAEKFGQNAVSSLTIDRHGEKENIDWNRAVREMEKRKDNLINDEAYKKDIETFNNYYASDEAKEKAYGRIVSRQEEFQKQVKGMVDNLVNEYQGTFDRNKFSATVRLMTFDENAQLNSSKNIYGDYLSGEQSKLNRDIAIESMVRLGFQPQDGDSIFGYYKYDSKTGEAAIEYSSPLAILNFENTRQMQDKINLAAVRDIAKESKLYDRHEAVKKQLDVLWDKYNAKGVSSAKKKEIKSEITAAQISWNSEVAAELAPYISQMTPEAAINNKGVLDYLYTYIEVPESYKTNDKGGYINLGSDGNKKKAYIDSYIKRMFSVNDPYKGQY